MNVREKTGLIIRKNDRYLVACQIGTKRIIWSISPWDAWMTRKTEDAKRVQSIIGGELILFNPIVGQIRKANV